MLVHAFYMAFPFTSYYMVCVLVGYGYGGTLAFGYVGLSQQEDTDLVSSPARITFTARGGLLG